MTGIDPRLSRKFEGGDRSPSLGNRLRRAVSKYALQVLGGTAVIMAGMVMTCARGVYDLPTRLSTLEAQVSMVTTRQRVDSARTDSLYRINAGVLSVLCFGLSDKAFEAARQTCGEAFSVSRILSGERVQREGPR